MEWTKRPARTADKDALFALRRDHLEVYVSGTYGWDERAQRAFFEEDWQRASTTVVEVDGEVVAAYRTRESSGALLLVALEVTPRLRKRGLGGAILRSLMDAHKKIEVSVAKANEGARRFYLREGFVEVEAGEFMWSGDPRPHSLPR